MKHPHKKRVKYVNTPLLRVYPLDVVQVCEVYTLHRETYYLAVDYIDRYLSNTKNIHKTRLQLVGVTALFIAAKLEVG